jgi:hypothetical protein
MNDKPMVLEYAKGDPMFRARVVHWVVHALFLLPVMVAAHHALAGFLPQFARTCQRYNMEAPSLLKFAFAVSRGYCRMGEVPWILGMALLLPTLTVRYVPRDGRQSRVIYLLVILLAESVVAMWLVYMLMLAMYSPFMVIGTYDGW